jgi:hypothetical protein
MWRETNYDFNCRTPSSDVELRWHLYKFVSCIIYYKNFVIRSATGYTTYFYAVSQGSDGTTSAARVLVDLCSVHLEYWWLYGTFFCTTKSIRYQFRSFEVYTVLPTSFLVCFTSMKTDRDMKVAETIILLQVPQLRVPGPVALGLGFAKWFFPTCGTSHTMIVTDLLESKRETDRYREMYTKYSY